METYTDFAVSYLIVNKIVNTVPPSPPPPPPEFQIFRKNILHFIKRAKMCYSNRSNGVYRLNQSHIT